MATTLILAGALLISLVIGLLAHEADVTVGRMISMALLAGVGAAALALGGSFL